MPSLRNDYRAVTAALDKAFREDKAAYEALPRRSKAFWALQPPKSWPTAPEFRRWYDARLALLDAEKQVFQMLRERCEALRQRMGRTPFTAPRHVVAHAPYMEHVADTVPDDLHLSEHMRLPAASAAPSAQPGAPLVRRTPVVAH